jgi:predicted HTH transcriptional regulator
MFEVMERGGLYPPEFRLEAEVIFTVVLRNTPVYDLETARWLKQFESLRLSGDQKRLLAYAREHGGTFTSRAYQKLVGADLYTASRDIKDLIRKGVARIRKKGGRVYGISELGAPVEIPSAFELVYDQLQREGQVTNQDLREILECDRHQAYRHANHWVNIGLLECRGKGRGAHYVIGSRLR